MSKASLLYKSFIDDWIDIVRGYGESQLGFKFPEHTRGDEDIWLADRMGRVPVAQPRIVEASDVFNVPAHRVAGWENLRIKIERGEDLLSYLSRQVCKIGRSDPMLNHWSINHFHLGIGQDPRHPSLIEGTPEIVYASLVGNRFLALAIDDHGKWTDKDLLETIERCWPDHPGLKQGMTLASNYTEEEEIALRQANINVPTRLHDGSHFLSFGETLGGSSALASLQAIGDRGRIAKQCLDLAKERGADRPDDAVLEVRDGWELHIDFPDIGGRVALFTSAGATLTAGDVVESWRC